MKEGTGWFLRRMLAYRPWLYSVDGLVWIGVYTLRLVPGLVAQRAFDTLQAGRTDPPAILWFAALFLGVGVTQAVVNTTECRPVAPSGTGSATSTVCV